jgi:hypothetical protein
MGENMSMSDVGGWFDCGEADRCSSSSRKTEVQWCEIV